MHGLTESCLTVAHCDGSSPEELEGVLERGVEALQGAAVAGEARGLLLWDYGHLLYSSETSIWWQEEIRILYAVRWTVRTARKTRIWDSIGVTSWVSH